MDGAPLVGETLPIGAYRSDNERDHCHQDYYSDHPPEDGQKLPEHHQGENDADYPKDPRLAAHSEEPSDTCPGNGPN